MTPIMGDGKDHECRAVVDEIEESIREAVHHGDHDATMSMDRMPSMGGAPGKRLGHR
jgi:hypothetical protein